MIRLLLVCPLAAALSTSTPTAARAALREWLVPQCPGLDGSRATLEDAADGWTVRAARAYNRGQVVFSVGDGALQRCGERADDGRRPLHAQL